MDRLYHDVPYMRLIILSVRIEQIEHKARERAKTKTGGRKRVADDDATEAVSLSEAQALSRGIMPT
ncbi:MAG: hypothetical protein F4Y39_24720 [Gemmatimonadetes bacterium]|nr:hypothetical protein [Gemmatimonadota bacterium]MYF80028.1 hypothetical protein [Chloroflexota bacterium]